MALSFVEISASGSTNLFSFSFSYTAQSEIKAYVDGVEDTSFTFNNSQQLQLSSTPTASAVVRIERVTNLNTRAVDFQSGAVLTEADLDSSAMQMFNAAQESKDKVDGAVALANDGTMDAQSKRIKNVANPTADQDAVTKHYLENTWLSTANKTALTTVNSNISDINTLAASAVVTDMSMLAVSDVISDMNTLATADVVADLNTLAHADVVSDMNTLAVTDVINDMNTLATTANVSNMASIASGSNLTNIAGIIGTTNLTNNIGTVAANTGNLQSVGNNITEILNVNTNLQSVVDVDSDITNVNTVATNIGSVNTVAGKATEIGRLGTADAVADMAILGTTDVVADMNTLATADIVSDMNTLAHADVVSDMNTLAHADVVSDMNTLAVSDVISDMNTLANADVISDMNALATSDIISDLNTLATTDIVDDMNTLATTANVNNMATLGASGVVANIATVAGISGHVSTVAGNNANISTVAGNNANVSAVGGISSNVTTVAGIASDVTGVHNIANAVAIVANDATDIGTVSTNISNVNTLASALTVGGTTSYTVTVVNSGGNKFALGGATNPTLSLKRGITYTFDQSDSTNANHPLRFKDSSGNSYTTGVTYSGTAGQAGAEVVFAVPSNAPSSLLYYCVYHGNAMGNTISVQDDNVAIVAGISSNITALSPRASDIQTLSPHATAIGTVATNITSVNDFADKYRIASSAPSSNNDEGDLYYNTTSNQLFVYDGSAWISAALDASSALVPSNNLSDVPSASTARTNLGLGDASTKTVGIGSGNVGTFAASVADNDFLKIDGTTVEGRSASEVLSDIGALSTSVASSTYAPLSGASFSGAISSSSTIIATSKVQGATVAVDTNGGFYLKQDSSKSTVRSESQPIVLQTYASGAWQDRVSVANDGNATFSGTVTSPIFNTGSGDLRADGNNLNIVSQNGETHANFYNNGGIRLLHDNSPFLTSNAGSITLSNSNDTDDALIFLGANNRANLYSVDGSYVTLKSSGSSGNDDVVSGTVDSYTYLYHNGSYTFRTEADGARVVNASNNNDGILYLGNTYGYIYNDMSTAISIYNGSNDAVLFGNHNSYTYLYFNGSSTARTLSGGLQVYDLGNNDDGYLYLGDNGNTYVQGDYSAGFGIVNQGDWVLWADTNSYTYLYYNGSYKMRTVSDGIQINNTAYANTNLAWNYNGSTHHTLTSNNSNNPHIKGSATGSAGLLITDSAGNTPTQLYANLAGYGFLDSAWGNWDIQKVPSGAMTLNGSETVVTSSNISTYASGSNWEHVSFTNFSGASALDISVARGYWYRIEFHDHQVDHSSGQRRWQIRFHNESYGWQRNESNNYLDCQGFHLQYLNQSTGNWPWASGQVDSDMSWGSHAFYGQTNLCTEGENNPDFGTFEFFQSDTNHLYTGDNNYCTFRLKTTNAYWGQLGTSVVKISGTNGAATTTINKIKIENIWGNNFRMKVHVTRLKRS